MKILFLVDSIIYSGGIQRMLTSKANYLASKKEYEIHILCYDKQNSKSFFHIEENIHIHYIGIENSKNSVLKKITLLPQIIYRTIKKANEINPDIIVNENMKTMTFILPYIIRKIPIIYVLHFSFDGLMQMSQDIYKNFFIRKCITLFRFHVLKKYKKFIVLTEEDKKKWKLPNIQVIPNFTCINNKLKSDLSHNKVVFVGRFSPEKDVSILINAWQKVSKIAPNWTLDLYGDGEEKDKIIELIDKLELKNSVNLKGWSNQIENIYRDSSLLVLPSKFEGFVLVVLEALTMGIPCITFDIPGCNNLIKNNINGFLIKQRSHVDLAQKIIEYIQCSHASKMEIQKRIPKTIEKYSKNMVMDKWEELFYQCIIQKQV